MKLWSMIWDQQDVGMDGPTSLKVDVVLAVMNLIGIPENKKMESLEIMKNCWIHFEYKARQDRDRKQEKINNSNIQTKNIKRQVK